MHRALTAIVVLAVAVNIAVNTVLPGWAYVPAMAGGGVAAVIVARRFGVTRDDLGHFFIHMDETRMPRC